MKNLNEEKKWFGFYRNLPNIVACILGIAFGLPALIALLFNLRLFLIIAVISAIIGTITIGITYACMKISLSPMILQIEYLEQIVKNTTPAEQRESQ